MTPTEPASGDAVLERPVQLHELVGSTPMIDLSALLPGGRPKLLAKAEQFNPGGSVKDRPALAIIQAAIESGSLRPGRSLLDATSGNTGIAYAMIGASMGIEVTLCLPANASRERKLILSAYGAAVVETDPLEGSDGAILEARRRAEADPERYVYVDQYSNPENPASHYRGTGPEILRQTDGAITHFITGLGTSGTFMGVGRFLRERVPQVRLVSVEPDSPFHGLEGMKHMESAIVPPIYDPSLADERRVVATERAHDMVRRLGREHGLLVGVSAGGNVAAALELALQLEADGQHDATVVTVLCDGAEKYLSETFWSLEA